MPRLLTIIELMELTTPAQMARLTGDMYASLTIGAVALPEDPEAAFVIVNGPNRDAGRPQVVMQANRALLYETYGACMSADSSMAWLMRVSQHAENIIFTAAEWTADAWDRKHTLQGER